MEEGGKSRGQLPAGEKLNNVVYNDASRTKRAMCNVACMFRMETPRCGVLINLATCFNINN